MTETQANSLFVRSTHRVSRKIRRVLGIKQLPELDQRLSRMERIFHAPPLTSELIAAIKLISPHCDLAASERHRLVWEADQNGACWGEYEALEPFLSRIPTDAKILEIGPGMGRSLVFFAKKLGWRGDQLYAYEGNGHTTKYTLLGPRFEDSFCGNIALLRHVLDFNSVRDVTIFDAANTGLAELPGRPYDLVYSFYSIGYHWSLQYFLNDLLPLLDDGGTAIFTTSADFEPFESLRKLPYRLVDWKPAWPKDAISKFIVLSKADKTPI
jgi:SAM-dependent methyltransferase